jgi:hypothetical protein
MFLKPSEYVLMGYQASWVLNTRRPMSNSNLNDYPLWLGPNDRAKTERNPLDSF